MLDTAVTLAPPHIAIAPHVAMAPHVAAASHAGGAPARVACRVAAIWIDWYPYHVARFRGLASHPELLGTVAGIELVGGVGVHAGLRFRENLPVDLAQTIHTLLPDTNWADAGQLRVARLLWAKLNQLNPEVVLVPGYYTLPAIAAALWARLHGRKGVLMTESTREDHTRSAWKEAAKSLGIRTLFPWAVAGGRRHRRYLAALGFPVERTVGFYDVVDNAGLGCAVTELRRAGRAVYGLPERYFLYVGRLAPEKNIGGPSGLLSAYIAYRSVGGRWPLVLVGDGPESPALQEQAARSPYAPDIHFAGHKGSAKLLPYYAFASCFVLPSTREPWGLVVNEAMACGLPVVVSSRCGCADDLVATGQNGFTFNPARPGELQASLAAMEALTPYAWARMGTLSLERIAGYSPEAFGTEIAGVANADNTLGALGAHRSA